jgi:hypothetical protein
MKKGHNVAPAVTALPAANCREAEILEVFLEIVKIKY